MDTALSWSAAPEGEGVACAPQCSASPIAEGSGWGTGVHPASPPHINRPLRTPHHVRRAALSPGPAAGLRPQRGHNAPGPLDPDTAGFYRVPGATGAGPREWHRAPGAGPRGTRRTSKPKEGRGGGGYGDGANSLVYSCGRLGGVLLVTHTLARRRGMRAEGCPGRCMRVGGGGGGGGRMHWKGPSRAPSLFPATVPLTPSASLNGVCNRQ